MELEDYTSGIWKRFVLEIEERIEVLHKELEQDADESKTAKIRGRLAELRRLQNLGKQPIEFKQGKTY